MKSATRQLAPLNAITHGSAWQYRRHWLRTLWRAFVRCAKTGGGWLTSGMAGNDVARITLVVGQDYSRIPLNAASACSRTIGWSKFEGRSVFDHREQFTVARATRTRQVLPVSRYGRRLFDHRGYVYRGSRGVPSSQGRYATTATSWQRHGLELSNRGQRGSALRPTVGRLGNPQSLRSLEKTGTVSSMASVAANGSLLSLSG